MKQVMIGADSSEPRLLYDRRHDKGDEEPCPLTPGTGRDDMATTASPISSFNFPSNHAYTASGYDGLLLHAISPRLAEAVYPWVATPAAAKVVAVSLFVGGGFSSLPIISKRFPVEWALGSFVIHIPFLHAAMLIDLRELRLLFRQFEMWYMLATLVVMTWATLEATDNTCVKIFAMNGGVSAITNTMLDAVRVPPAMTLLTAGAYMGMTTFTTFFIFFQLTPWVEYDRVMLAEVTAASVLVGRVATLALFFSKYTYRLWKEPGCYVVLKAPLLREVDDARLTQISRMRQTSAPPRGLLARLAHALSHVLHPPSSKPTVAPLPAHTPNSSISLADTASPSEGTISDHLVLGLFPPSIAAPLYRHLSNKVFGTAMLRLSIVALCIALLPLLSAALPLPLSCALASLLLLLPALSHLLLIDRRLLPLVLVQFDTLWLGANVLLAFVCLAWPRVVREAEVMVCLVCVFVYTCTAIVVIDAVHVGQDYRLCMAGLSTAMCLVPALSLTAAPHMHMDPGVKLVFNISVASVIRGRLFTLSIYALRYAVNLWFRPNIYVVLHQPLSRIEQHNNSLMITLRDAAKPLASLMLQGGEAGSSIRTTTGGGEEAMHSRCSKSSDTT